MCFLLQPLTNYQFPALGGHPCATEVKRVTCTAACNKVKNSVHQWNLVMSMSSTRRGQGKHKMMWGLGRKPLDCTDLSAVPPGQKESEASNRCLTKLPHSSWHFFLECLWTAFTLSVTFVFGRNRVYQNRADVPITDGFSQVSPESSLYFHFIGT